MLTLWSSVCRPESSIAAKLLYVCIYRTQFENGFERVARPPLQRSRRGNSEGGGAGQLPEGPPELQVASTSGHVPKRRTLTARPGQPHSGESCILFARARAIHQTASVPTPPPFGMLRKEREIDCGPSANK